MIEDRARPHGLRTFLSDGFRDKPDARSAVTFSSGPSALLLLHGVNSSSHSCFRVPTDLVKLLERRYGGRVLAFDHSTLGYSPRENAEQLAEQLVVPPRQRRHPGPLAVDWSPGSSSPAPEGVNIRSVVHVATPNGGTPLADASYLGQFLSVATNAIGFIPDNPVTDVFGIVLDVLREWVLELAGELPGVAAMKPGSSELHELNRGSQPGLAASSRLVVRAGSEPGRPEASPRPGHGPRRRCGQRPLVPTRSTYRRTDQFHIPVGRRLVLDTSFAVSHSQFWTEPQVTSVLERWLDPTADVNEADDVPAKLTDPAAELDDATSTGNVDAMRRAISLLGSDKLGLISELVGGPLPARSRGSGPATKQGTVVVLPGVMGSRLTTTENGREVWFSPWHLLRGRFTDLSLDTDEPMEVEVTGMVRQYTPSSHSSTARGMCSRSPTTGAARSHRPHESSPRGWRPRVSTSEVTARSTSSVTAWVAWSLAPSWSSITRSGRRAWSLRAARHAQLGIVRHAARGVGRGTTRSGARTGGRLPRGGGDPRHDRAVPRRPRAVPVTRTSHPRRHYAEHSLLYEAATWPKRTSPAFTSGLTEARPRDQQDRGSTAWSMWPVTTRPRRTVSGSTPTRRSASA